MNVSDAAGNWDTAMINVIVRDTIPPTITITSPENNFITNQNITLTYIVSDNVDSTENITLSVENGTIYINEGNYTITINATDRARNIGWKTVSFVIDRTEPEITITGAVNNGYYNVSVIPIIYVTDSNLNTTSVTLNNETFISGTVVTDNGNYIPVVEATDKAGNTANKMISFIIDKPPHISITGVEDNTYYNVDVIPMIDIVDTNLNNTIITLNDNVFLSGTPISEEGTHILTVWANDAKGNTASKTIMFAIDKTKPVITFINVTDNTYYPVTVTFMVKITEKNQYMASGKLNMIDFDPAATIMVIAEGKYTLVVQAVDKAGNTANKTITFTIDKTKPTLSDIILENGTKTTKDSIMISGKTEPNAVVKINRVDVTVSSDGSFSKEIMLVKGVNTVTITATDLAGNTNTYTITINKIETPKPAIISGFEAIMLIITLGLAIVLLKRKR